LLKKTEKELNEKYGNEEEKNTRKGQELLVIPKL
jgi:hypothetical protein